MNLACLHQILFTLAVAFLPQPMFIPRLQSPHACGFGITPPSPHTLQLINHCCCHEVHIRSPISILRVTFCVYSSYACACISGPYCRFSPPCGCPPFTHFSTLAVTVFESLMYTFIGVKPYFTLPSCHQHSSQLSNPSGRCSLTGF